MDPTRGRANVGGDVFEKSNDVVIRPLFDFGDLIDLERPFLANDRASSFGIKPSRAIASQAMVSISSQI